VRLFDQRVRGYVAQSGLTHDRIAGVDAGDRAPSHHAVFRVDAERFEMGPGQDSLRVPMTWTSEDGSVTVTKTFVFQRGTHLIEVEHQVENRGDSTWIGRQYRQLRHGPTPPRAAFFLYTFTGAAYFDGKYNKESFESLRDSPLEKRVEGGWISVIEHYFMSAWIPGQDEINAMYGRAVPGAAGVGTDYLIGMHSAEPITIAPGGSGLFSTRLWVGPKTQADLREIAPGLELTVDYGIFTFLSKPLFWLLRVIHDFVGNWGWSIIILTILIKLAFFHLSATSYRSMARMRAVAPKLQAMKERYKDDKQRMNTALMELYKKEKINPLGGCLPILVQIPVFIALYWVLLESVELRQAPWIAAADGPDDVHPVQAEPAADGSNPAEDLHGASRGLHGLLCLLPGRSGVVLVHQQPVLDRAAVRDHTQDHSGRRKEELTPCPAKPIPSSPWPRRPGSAASGSSGCRVRGRWRWRRGSPARICGRGGPATAVCVRPTVP